MADLEAKVRALECWARRDITVKPLSESGIEGLGEGRTNHNFVVTVTHHDGAELHSQASSARRSGSTTSARLHSARALTRYSRGIAEIYGLDEI